MDFSRVIKGFDLELREVRRLARPGLKLEFGVGRGHSFKMIAKMWPRCIVWGFDSLWGLPEPWDKGSKTQDMSLHGTPPPILPNARLVEGFFTDTLPQWWADHRAPIAFLHIDSDLYSSAKFVLDTLDDGIMEDTIIRFDEWGNWNGKYPNWRDGECRAFMEWVGDRRVEPLWRNLKQAATIRVCA